MGDIWQDANAHFSRPWGAVSTLIGTSAAASLLLPAHFVSKMTVPGYKATRLPRLFHRLIGRAIGIRSVTYGQQAGSSGVMFVSNHLSWADIPVIGAHIAGSFVARADLAGWGVFGWMADQQRTIYIERGRRQSTTSQLEIITERLAQGENVILFPEGTTSEGLRVLPFKSSLFAVADQADMADLLIQPVSLAYTRLNGLPIRRHRRPQISWTGDMELLPHALDFMRLGRIQAELLFHEPIRRREFPDRKALARHCQQVITEGYARLMRQHDSHSH